MTIKAIIFDLDDTLVEEVASAQAAFLAACALAQERYGIAPETLRQTVRRRARELWHKSPARGYAQNVGISSWEALWGRFLGDDPNLKTLREWTPTYRREAWRRALADYDVHDPHLVKELIVAFQRERRARHVVYPDVEPALQDLRRRYPLALLTNGAPDLQREKLTGSKLGPYFDLVVVSGDHGWGKPDPRIFAVTLERLEVAPEQAVMIGNSLRSDVAGAQEAGIKAIWVNRSKQENDTGIQPDAQIWSLSQLSETLEITL